MNIQELLQKALANGQDSLSEYDSKRLLASRGVPICREILTGSRQDAIDAARQLGFPVALKGCGWKLKHKTEMGLVRLDCADEQEVSDAYDSIIAAAGDCDGVLVQEMIRGNREFVIGMSRDQHFGPTVMFGLGGIFTEALNDVSFRVAPLSLIDAGDMLDDLRSKKLLASFRGSPAVNREIVQKTLVAIGDLAVEFDAIAEIDINPLIIAEDLPVAVDALIILKK